MAKELVNSGIEWIGIIPSTWNLCKGKYLFRQRNEKGNRIELQLLSPTQKYGVIPQEMYEELSGMTAVKLDESADFSTLKSIYEGDFCISLRSFQGGFEYSKYNGVVSPAYQVFYKTAELCDTYYRYLFKDQGFISKMNSYTKTFRDGKNISFTDFGNSLIPVPPVEEQKQIAFFLDAECARIDSVIEQTRASIEEYKKLKQAVITRAVTKGIRPDRAMKDSGIEWIGEVPVEWDVIISRFTLDQIGDVDHYMPESVDVGIPYVMTGDLKKVLSDIDFERCKKISSVDYEKLRKKITLSLGDIIFARYATIGTVCYVDIERDCIISYSCVTIKPTVDKMYGKYLYYYLQSSSFFEDVSRHINSNTQGNVGIEALYSVKVPVPPILEQKEISDFLDNKIVEIDGLMQKKEQLLSKLDLYKRSLIFEYVTGKKEVV